MQYLESMADIVRQGIVKAVEDLEKENQEKLQQEVLHFVQSCVKSLTFLKTEKLFLCKEAVV